MGKKEICVDARMAASSGIGTYIRSLLPRLASSHRFCLIGDSDVISQYPELSHFDLIDTKVPIYSIREQLALPLLVPKCDLFWTPHFNIPLTPISSRKRLVTIHDVVFLACPQYLGLHKRLYARLFFNAAVRRSDHVITDSQFSLSEIIKYIGPYQKKITAISLGVDCTFSKFSIDVRPKVPQKYILYVGNLAPHKNICSLIRSLDFLPSDIHLVLVGQESQWTEWKQEAEKRQDRVTLCGKVKHETLIWLYENAELLIHPSHYEGFGFTPLEAMSLGCPVVSSHAASLPEVCGDAAIYIDPSSIEHIAQGILSVWSNSQRRNELRKKGLEQVKLFNWDVSAQKHLEVIEQVIS